MKTPPYLKSGDKIAIVAPAGKIAKDKIDTAIQTLESWGLKVIAGEYLFGSFHQFSATDDDRDIDFQKMLYNDSVRAILCARGGYGSNRIVDYLEFTNLAKSPKWIIGFSDITVFHSHIHTNFQVETIHGTMASGLNGDKKNNLSIDSLRKALFGEKLNYQLKAHPQNRKGNAEGLLTGGNLAILCSLIGTPSDIETSGKILFIEDVGEYLYRLDRMMWQLKRAGKLENIAGLVVGGLTEMKDNETPFGKTAHEIISDCIREYDYPVCFDFPAGHQDDNRAMIFGRNVRLEINDVVNLSFDSGEGNWL
ncbi:MAG: LD-carboxypeptidase [Bacteroidetes bacterium]|nr:MAG: LD-carboxypeptidase [Bacteroidota bacterium]